MAEREPTYVLQPGFAQEYDIGLRGGRREYVNPTRDLEIPPVPTHKPTETVAYKVEHAYDDKHFPKISQEQRDAARSTSTATRQDTAQLTFQMMEQTRSRDQGMER